MNCDSNGCTIKTVVVLKYNKYMSQKNLYYEPKIKEMHDSTLYCTHVLQ